MFEYPLWIDVLFWSILVLMYMWILGMWANAKDNQPKEEKEELTLVRAVGTTLLCVLIGVLGFGGGSWYTTDKLFSPLIKEVKETTFTARSVLREIKSFATKEEFNRRLKEIRSLVKEDMDSNLEKLSNDFDNVNERILLLSKELMGVHMELEMELLNLEDNTKSFIDSKITESEKEIKKQLGEMYDRVDVLYEDLEKISSTIDTAKETFLGKFIIK